MKKIAIATAAILAGLAATPALAEEVRVEVDYADLNIGTDEGASRLASRIAASVKTACAANEIRDLKGAARASACQNEMLTEAVAQLNDRGAKLAAQNLIGRG